MFKLLEDTGMASDEALMRRFYEAEDQETVNEVLGELVVRHHSALEASAYNGLPKKLAARRQIAEDSAADVWDKLLENKSSRFDPERGTTVRNWLRAMARNIAKNTARKERRQAILECDLQATDSSLLEQIPDHRAEAADAAVEEDQQRSLLWDMVTHLPDELETIVTLKVRDELTQREIARRSGCSEATISRRLKEARRWLTDLGGESQIAG